MRNMTKTNYVWIASYPKSGNTWIRFLITSLLDGAVSTSKQMEEIVPDVHKLGKNIHRFEGVVYLKTHWKLTSDFPFKEQTIGAIYVVRNPLDVIVSHLNYFRISDNGPAKSQFVSNFIANKGFQGWLRFKMGTWSENVRSWIYQPNDFPRLVIRYEDLKQDTFSVVRDLCQFLGLERTDADLKAAIAQSSFESLRNMEKRELNNGVPGFFQSEHSGKTDPNYQFIHKGKTNTFSEILTDSQIRAALTRFDDLLELLSYDTILSEYQAQPQQFLK